ncbi:methyltransferase domain-containing protein [Candidatus Woesearchaeota archaeon]|nr:methyltransferase domain-containing protein [Candidatus Woesearchaeota archaeon]
MKYIFLLSGDYIGLGKEETLSLFDVRKSKLVDRLLVFELDNGMKSLKESSQRLALTKNIYKLLFECGVNELPEAIKNFGWNSVYRDNFCLRIHDFNKTIDKINSNTRTTSESKGYRGNPFINVLARRSDMAGKRRRALESAEGGLKKDKHSKKIYSEKDLAGYIWRSLKNPKANLKNPRTKIELFFVDNKAYCGLLIEELHEDFESRKAHLRPFPHPSSLNPKVARALVNITGIKENEVLLDPFCGTGGFLIEAGLMKIKVIGDDINKIMVNGCIKNLKHFKIKNYKIKRKNALDINDRFDCVVTDLPYGLNSNALLKYEKDWKMQRLNLKIQKKDFYKNLEKFYLKFLKNLRKKLKKKAVIVFPHYVDYKKILKISKFKIEKEFSNYVHRSLTRKIVKVS